MPVLLNASEPGVSATSGFRQAVAGYRYVFPQDHGSHDEFRTEWWYYTGHLLTPEGRRFGYQLTFFRRAMAQEEARSNPSRWAIRQLYLAHFALSDLGNGRFHYAEKVSRAGIGKAGAETGRLRVWIDRWFAEASSPVHAQHHLNASAADFRIDLLLRPEKPPIIHGR
ncbi:MAG: lipocalin-like domain-containing protein, partial [Nitrospiraceae bacterium]